MKFKGLHSTHRNRVFILLYVQTLKWMAVDIPWNRNRVSDFIKVHEFPYRRCLADFYWIRQLSAVPSLRRWPPSFVIFSSIVALFQNPTHKNLQVLCRPYFSKGNKATKHCYHDFQVNRRDNRWIPNNY